MVLDRQDHHFHACGFHGLAPLVRVELFQVEDFRVFLSVSPFQASEAVRPEVDKGDKLVLQGCQLVRSRYDMSGLFDDCRMTVGRLYRDRVPELHLLVLVLGLSL